ncbi:hypothetical protein BDZ45DRAFT_672953 [Acephala macrosclerotiorum]|nr:hypothetical protein BDZ45DRAFT_672953 [Acephala macrosclerotiorum]
MAGLKDQLEAAQEALTKSRRETVRAEANVLDYEGRLTVFQKELEAEQAAHREAKDEVQRLKGEGTQREAHIENIEKQLEDCFVSEERLNKLDERHKEELEAERRKYRALQSRMDAQGQEYANFKNDTDGLHRQVDPIKKSLEIAKGELEAAGQQILELTGGEQRAIDAKDAVINGLKAEIAALKKDAAPRTRVRPSAYQDDPNAPPPKQKDLLEEIVDSRVSTPSSSDNRESSSEATATDASEDTDGEQSDGEKPKLEGNDEMLKPEGNDNANGGETIRVVTLPGDNIYIPNFITTTIRDLNPITAWLACERNVVILLYGFLAYMGIGWPLFSMRSRSSVDQNPVPAAEDGAAADGDAITDAVASGDANSGAANSALAMSSINIGATPAPGGPIAGTDPSDALASTGDSSSGPSINLEDFFDPIDPPANDRREQFDDGSNNSNGSNGRSGSPILGLEGPPEPVHTGPEGFFDIRNAPTPNICWTLLAFIIHLVVYYFIYLCYCSSQEHSIWWTANDLARTLLFQLFQQRNRYSLSFYHYVFSHHMATRIDRLTLVLVQLFGVQIQTYPLPG